MASFKRRKSSGRNVSSSSPNLHIPEDITIDILSRLPVKSLARFLCVCKTWRSLIRHSFASKGCNLLVTSQLLPNDTVDADTDTDIYMDVFRDGDFDAPIHSGIVLPSPWTEVEDMNIISSNNGLLCVEARTYHSYVIWNPTTRQFREIPKLELDKYEDEDADTGWRFLGFGVDAETDDYKLITLHPHYILDENQNHIGLMRVYMYSRSTGLWRYVDAPALTTINNHRITVYDAWSQIQIKGVLYWVPQYLEPSGRNNQIMGFEVREEKFLVLSIPDYYKRNGRPIFLCCELTEIEGSLALIASNNMDVDNVVHNIWMMNNEGSWVQKFTVRDSSNENLVSIHAWKNCLVTSSWEESDDQVELSLRRVDGDSSSVVQQIQNLSVPRDDRYSLKVHRYVESLTPV